VGRLLRKGDVLYVDGPTAAAYDAAGDPLDLPHEDLRQAMNLGWLEAVPDPEKNAVLDRLAAALARNPEMEYLLWKRMQDLRFHGPWEVNDEGECFIRDAVTGSPLGWLSEADGEWSFGINIQIGSPDGPTHALKLTPGKVRTAPAEAQMAAEEAIRREFGWRRVPTALWVPPEEPPAPPPPKPSLSDWTQIPQGVWIRTGVRGATVAAVGAASPQSLVEWTTWGHAPSGLNPEQLNQGSASSWDGGKAAADNDLVKRGLLEPHRAVDDPDIPF
jgi:hypothetical protein